MGEWKQSYIILDLSTKLRWVVPADLSLKGAPIPILQEAVWVPDLVWTVRRSEKSYLCWESNQIRQALSRRDTTELSMLHALRTSGILFRKWPKLITISSNILK
jgi:hypothetical protein